ncbi:MAG: hypothetical protein EBY24_02625 [Betaproteobacteria bacterium]|nr:hypothetical protein [Betaproteobacteria bacterium]
MVTAQSAASRAASAKRAKVAAAKKTTPSTKRTQRSKAPVAAKAMPAPAKPVLAMPATPSKTPPMPEVDALAKARKPKLVRDSFTIPKAEYSVLDELKQRAARAGSPAKKSELLRAGVKLLAAMNDDALVAALLAVPAIKTGRPTKI